MTPPDAATKAAGTTTTGYFVHLEVSGPCLAGYTPKVPRPITQLEIILSYLKVLYA